MVRQMQRRVPLARRNILFDRRRLATGVFGVGAAIALIFLLQGLWGGVQQQISTYIEHSGAQLFVGDSGTKTTSESSVVPMSAIDTIGALPGVSQADPLYLRSTILTLHGQKVFAALVGYDSGRMGGPWRIAEGRRIASNDEAVLDRTLAKQHGVAVGSSLDVMGSRFTVVGLSAETRTWMSAFVFVAHEAAQRLFATPDTTRFVLVRTANEASVAAAIDRLGFAALTQTQLIRGDRELLAGILKGPLELMVLIAFAAGTLIVALTVYSQVVERVREYGIVKAMGAKRWRLFGIVLGQTVVLAVLGIAAGTILFWLGGWAVTSLRPQFWVRLSGMQFVEVIAVAGVMALVAAVIPTRRISRLDPATVYRG